jgi:hypothetical protein
MFGWNTYISAVVNFADFYKDGIDSFTVLKPKLVKG